MAHHAHDHHDHQHPFTWAIALNAAYCAAEAFWGWRTGSLALLADAGHNLGDILTLLLAAWANRLAAGRSTHRFTYGYQRSTILAALANAVLLLIACGALGIEALHRFQHPSPVPGGTVAIVAAIGIAVNALSASLFRHHHHDLNARGAYLHLLADATVSAGVVIAGLLVYYTGLAWIDPLATLLVLAAIVWATWSLLRQSLHLALDAVPEGIHLQQLTDAAAQIPGIRRLYHVHVWALSTRQNALTAHVQLDPDLSAQAQRQTLESLRQQLRQANIHHITLEVDLPANDPAQ